MIPPKIQAKRAEFKAKLYAELERRLEALYEREEPAFKLGLVIHGEGGIPRRMEFQEIDRQQGESA